MAVKLVKTSIDKTGPVIQQQQTLHSSKILQIEVCILNKNLKQHTELFQVGKQNPAYQYGGP